MNIIEDKSIKLPTPRRASVLKNNHEGTQYSLIKDRTPEERRASLTETKKIIKASPVDFGEKFGDVTVDESSTPQMLRKSFLKKHGVDAAINFDYGCSHGMNFYRPRRESLKTRNQSRAVETEIESVNTAATSSVSENYACYSRQDDSSHEDETKIHDFVARLSGLHISNLGNSSSKSTTKRRVSFASVDIREHPYVLGDNPGVSSGVPLAIDWKSSHSETVPLDVFEDLRKNDRRFIHELKLPGDVRWDKAKNSGASSLEITMGIINADKTRHERNQTLNSLSKSRREERNESIRRGLKNIFTNHKKKENKYIEHALSFDN